MGVIPWLGLRQLLWREVKKINRTQTRTQKERNSTTHGTSYTFKKELTFYLCRDCPSEVTRFRERVTRRKIQRVRHLQRARIDWLFFFLFGAHLSTVRRQETRQRKRKDYYSFFSSQKEEPPLPIPPAPCSVQQAHPFKNKIPSKTARGKKKSILLREGEEILFDESQLAAVVATVKYATVQRGGTRKPFQLVRFFFILPRCSALLCSNLFMHVHTPQRSHSRLN